MQDLTISTNDVMKSEIQHQLEEAEREINECKELASKYQSEFNSHEETLRLLVKEGEYENAPSILHRWNFLLLLNICQF